jgi:hypothetical protein
MTDLSQQPAVFSGIPRKKPGRPIENRPRRFGALVRFDCTPAIAASIVRLSPPKAPMNASAVCRAALHQYCLDNDPIYARELAEDAENA